MKSMAEIPEYVMIKKEQEKEEKKLLFQDCFCQRIEENLKKEDKIEKQETERSLFLLKKQSRICNV